jgi:hypothetical protein
LTPLEPTSTPTPTSTATEIPAIVINEIHADPDDTDGDANFDAVIDTYEDEFTELVNTTKSPIDISNWTLSDAIGVKHTFTNTIIPAESAVVVPRPGILMGFKFIQPPREV